MLATPLRMPSWLALSAVLLLSACAGAAPALPPTARAQPAEALQPLERLPLLVAPTDFRLAGAAVLEGRLHLLGGHQHFEGRAQHWVLSPGSGTWQQAEAPPRGCYAQAVVAHEGRLYATGGLNSDPSLAVAISEFRCAGWMQVYDAATDRWLDPIALPGPRFHHAAAVLGEELIIAGGERVWEEGASMDEDPLNLVITATPEVWAYHLRTGHWRRLAPLPNERAGAAPAVVNGELWLLGGRAFGPMAGVDRYDPVANRWSAGPVLPQGVAWGAAALLSPQPGGLVLTGGQAETFGLGGQPGIWRLGAQGWQPVGVLDAPRSGHSAVVLGQVLHVLGGYGSGAPRTVERFRLP